MEGRGGLQFGQRARARECECFCICRERGHSKGLSGVWEGRGVSWEGGERSLSDPRGWLLGAQFLMMWACSQNGVEWGLGGFGSRSGGVGDGSWDSYSLCNCRWPDTMRSPSPMLSRRVGWRQLCYHCGSPFVGPCTTFFRARYVGRQVSWTFPYVGWFP